MNQCPACQSQLLRESVGGGNVRTYCQRCGFNEVRDPQGRSLLTGERGPYHPPAAPKPNMLLEG